MAAGYRRMAGLGGKAIRLRAKGFQAGRAKVRLRSYEEKTMPSQNAAINKADSTSSTRIRFLRTANRTTAKAQSRKPNSGQNSPDPNVLLHSPAASCIKNEADEATAVSRAPKAPASAQALAQSGSTQSLRASRQSSHVCSTTTPAISITNSATFPLLSANRLGYRTHRAVSPAGRSAKVLTTAKSVEGRCRRIPSAHCRVPCAAMLLRQTLLPLLLNYFAAAFPASQIAP